MKKDLKNISANNNLDFYFNEKNIPAQDIVKLTHDYFENGVRKGIFKPLDFLNLLWEQYNFVVKNINDAEKVINTLNNLPLSKEKKHILFGFILKWFGGYPINYTPKEYDITLKLIEKEFLGYNESTPEKKFCQKELERINEMKKVSNYFNDLLKKSQNYKGISLNEYIDEINPLEEIKEQCEIIFTDLAKDIEENRRTTKDVLKGLDLLISYYSTPNIKHNINNDRIIFFKDYLEAIKKRIELLYSAKPPQPINSEIDTEKYTAKHYLLAYLFECNAKGVSYPIGNKKELERIGNERMGAGKGNRFYKVFNEVINKDLNAEKNLLEIGGEYWRKAVIELSKAPELVENYLQSKQL